MQFYEWLKARLKFRWKKDCGEDDPGVDAILAVVRLIARLAKSAPTWATGPVPVMMSVGSLLPDLLRLLDEYDDIPCEIAALTPERYYQIIAVVIAEFGFNSGHAEKLVDFALKLISQASDFRLGVRQMALAV